MFFDKASIFAHWSELAFLKRYRCYKGIVMMTNSTDGLLGIDGGGTSCRIALLWRGNRYESRSGSANVTSDPQGAVGAISVGLTDVAKQAGIDVRELRQTPAHLGLAGATTPAVCDQVKAMLPLVRASVSDDQLTTLAGALTRDDGVVVSIGTGSFLARQQQEARWFLGGHGLALGDEASGAWLGRALLARVLHSVDGLAPFSPLTEDILTEFGGEAGAVSLFAATASPARYGQYAPKVVAAAGAGDVAGLALMQSGAAYILAGLKALTWQEGDALCLMGSLGPLYRPYLPDHVTRCVRAPKGTALDGALFLAGQARAVGTPPPQHDAEQVSKAKRP